MAVGFFFKENLLGAHENQVATSKEKYESSIRSSYSDPRHIMLTGAWLGEVKGCGCHCLRIGGLYP